MANGTNGSKISEKTWLNLGLVLTLCGFVAFAAADRASTKKDIAQLQKDVAELNAERDALRGKLADYRAQVDLYRTQHSVLGQEIESARARIGALELVLKE